MSISILIGMLIGIIPVYTLGKINGRRMRNEIRELKRKNLNNRQNYIHYFRKFNCLKHVVKRGFSTVEYKAVIKKYKKELPNFTINNIKKGQI